MKYLRIQISLTGETKMIHKRSLTIEWGVSCIQVWLTHYSYKCTIALLTDFIHYQFYIRKSMNSLVFLSITLKSLKFEIVKFFVNFNIRLAFKHMFINNLDHKKEMIIDINLLSKGTHDSWLMCEQIKGICPYIQQKWRNTQVMTAWWHTRPSNLIWWS